VSRHWTEDDAGDLTGVTVLVTGGNSGIGAEAVRIFAEHGARVLLACRTPAKGEPVAQRLADAPGAVEVVELDLADLTSVDVAAERVRERTDRLDILVNNAGVMATPYRQTVDGFELQLGTNHLGHYALTAHLLPHLLRSPAPRVVTVSSLAHTMGSIDFDNLDGSRGYQPWEAYGQSKLANLLFTLELQRRSDEASAGLLATAAHPGYTATNLQTSAPAIAQNPAGKLLMRFGNLVLGQSAKKGALPTVRAAVDPAAEGAAYYGPHALGGWRGHPVTVGRTSAARDADLSRRLWEVSAELTGVEPDLARAGA
jgi:NAD(P)-dependent dehydrogenase (short-subunit alcohol dehydrogenase family)